MEDKKKKDKFVWEKGDVDIIMPDDPNYEKELQSAPEDEKEDEE